ncbi:MAG: thioredoxin domain-containing protein [Anaerolineae bacterium]|nr:thioredoxin domain-containing protein [Anaerolineae bacterium]
MNDADRTVNKLLEQAERELQPRRRIPLVVMILPGLMILGLIAFLIYREISVRNAPIPDNLGTLYAGLERGTTEQGFPRLGRADAPILIEDFSSYVCPHCRDFHNEYLPAFVDEITAGEVQFVFVPIANIGPGATDATKGAFCAGEQGQFWEMSDVLFDWQDRFLIFTFDPRRLIKGANAMGLDGDAFEACLSAKSTQQFVDAAQNEFKGRGLSGTPTLFINGEQVRDYADFDDLIEP